MKEPDSTSPMTECAHLEEAGVEIPEVYDGVLVWACTACGRLRHRWPVGSPHHARAVTWAMGRGLIVEPNLDPVGGLAARRRSRAQTSEPLPLASEVEGA